MLEGQNIVDSGRQRARRAARENRTEDEIVPREDERQDRADDDAGTREGQRDVAEQRPGAAAVDQRSLFELFGQRLEMSGHHIDDNRNGDHKMRDDQRRQCVVEAEKLKHGKQWNEIGHEAMGLQPRDAIARRHADGKRDQCRATGHDDAVPKVQPHRIFSEDLDVVLERRRIGNEDRRIGEVVDFVLERQRQHPEENQNRRRDDDDDREPESGTAHSATKTRPRPRTLYRNAWRGRRMGHSTAHCARCRTCSSNSASARMIPKNTTTTADALPTL